MREKKKCVNVEKSNGKRFMVYGYANNFLSYLQHFQFCVSFSCKFTVACDVPSFDFDTCFASSVLCNAERRENDEIAQSS